MPVKPFSMRAWREWRGFWKIAASVMFGLMLQPAWAEDLNYNLVSLGSEARQEVVNDWMHAVLALDVQDRDPARLGQAVNRQVQQALAKARAFPEVRLQSQGYQTLPENDERGRLTGWRAQARFLLEGADFARLGALIGELQASGLVVQGMGFEVSPKRRREVEDALVKEAIAAFRHRAEITQQALGAARFRVVDLQVDGLSDATPRMALMESRQMGMAKRDAVPVETQAGVTELVIRVNGRVQLDAD
jgi:predicted secreted protein